MVSNVHLHLKEYRDGTLLDVITEGRSADPEELLIGRESYVSIESRIDEALSPLERREGFRKYIQNYIKLTKGGEY